MSEENTRPPFSKRLLRYATEKEMNEVLKITEGKRITDVYYTGEIASCTFGWYGLHRHFAVRGRKERMLYCNRTGVIHVLSPARLTSKKEADKGRRT